MHTCLQTVIQQEYTQEKNTYEYICNTKILILI